MTLQRRTPPLVAKLLPIAGVVAVEQISSHLQQYSVRKLLENKLVPTNFTVGMRLTNSLESNYELSKFSTMLKTALKKRCPWMNTVVKVFYRDYIPPSDKTATLKLILRPDRAVTRYLRLLGMYLLREGIPITILAGEFSPFGTTRIMTQVTFSCMLPDRQAAEAYLLLEYIPEFLTVLKTLSRKAIFEETSLNG